MLARGMALVCLPLAAPIGLSPVHILTLCGSERFLVVSTEPLDDLSCLTWVGLGWVGSRLAPKVVTHGQCARTSPP